VSPFLSTQSAGFARFFLNNDRLVPVMTAPHQAPGKIRRASGSYRAFRVAASQEWQRPVEPDSCKLKVHCCGVESSAQARLTVIIRIENFTYIGKLYKGPFSFYSKAAVYW